MADFFHRLIEQLLRCRLPSRVPPKNTIGNQRPTRCFSTEEMSLASIQTSRQAGISGKELRPSLWGAPETIRNVFVRACVFLPLEGFFYSSAHIFTPLLLILDLHGRLETWLSPGCRSVKPAFIAIMLFGITYETVAIARPSQQK